MVHYQCEVTSEFHLHEEMFAYKWTEILNSWILCHHDNLKIVNRQSFKHNKSCFSFDSGTAVNTILNKHKLPIFNIFVLSSPFPKRYTDLVTTLANMKKHSWHFADRDRDSKTWNTRSLNSSSQMIQPCMFPYQMIKRQLVNMYVYVKHTNELGQIFQTPITIFSDFASPI